VLVPIGVVMTLFPVFYAVIENDLRKVLAYSLNNQLGFMVTGIGIGTAMSLDGTVAHAFCHILYKALLFMAMGAILHRVGTTKASELGGLYKSMPLSTMFCIVGAMSISAFPLFSGFVSKSLVMTAAADEHHVLAFIGLIIASAGVMEHSGIKIPVMGFFGPDKGIRVKEAPPHMLLAMGVTAAMCIGLGVYPKPLYAILPSGGVGFNAYTPGHVLTQLELLLFAALAFGVLIKTHLYPHERPSVNLDFDWTYRKLAPAVVGGVASVGARVRYRLAIWGERILETAHLGVYRLHGPEGVFARTWTTGSIAFWAVLGLGLYLLLYLWERM
jgi:multicomponent Na+:H+ antiporter subunit D